MPLPNPNIEINYFTKKGYKPKGEKTCECCGKTIILYLNSRLCYLLTLCIYYIIFFSESQIFNFKTYSSVFAIRVLVIVRACSTASVKFLI